MKLLLILLVLIASGFGYIDPTLDAQRRAILPQFLFKVTGDRASGVNNLTTYASSDYCWDIEYSGSFCQSAATDYVSLIFVQLPYYNATSGQIVYFTVSYDKINILEVDLVNDGLTNDTYVIKYVLNQTLLNVQTYTYAEQDGLFYTAYYTFQKGSALISTEVVVSSDGAKVVQSQTAYADATQICVLIAGIPGVYEGACQAGTPYQQYQSYQDCVAKFTAIDNQNLNKKGGPCPDYEVSNTTECRALHAAVTLTDPPNSQIIHCPHTGTPSTICIDYCDSVCSNCNANASCQYEVNIYGVRSYQCICNPGYSGDGVTTCTANKCTANYQCGTGNYYNYGFCNTSISLCQCQPTFVWNPLTSRCECQGNSSVYYLNGQATCLPLGRCVTRDHCTSPAPNSNGVSQPSIGDWNALQCVAYGPITTLFPYDTCVCNYGYTGGFYIPCTCPTGRSVVWSSTINGNVCLASGQCTASYECSSGQTCNFSKGPGYGVGVCQ